jgi:hypothetical protein
MDGSISLKRTLTEVRHLLKLLRSWLFGLLLSIGVPAAVVLVKYILLRPTGEHSLLFSFFVLFIGILLLAFVINSRVQMSAQYIRRILARRRAYDEHDVRGKV